MREEIEGFIKGFVKDYKTKNNTVTDWEEPLIAFADANDPLFFLYTSGTTGKPKGIIHAHGGYAVGTKFSLATKTVEESTIINFA